MPTRIGPKHPRRTYMREWRKHKHLSQQQVADRLGENVTKATVSRWENGRRRVPLEAYAEAIGEPVEKLCVSKAHGRPRGRGSGGGHGRRGQGLEAIPLAVAGCLVA